MNWFAKRSIDDIEIPRKEDLPSYKATPDLGAQVKSGGNPSYVSYLLSRFGDGITGVYLPPITAYRFYHKIGPLQSGVSKVTEAIGALPLVLKSVSDPDQITTESEVLDLLNNPSGLTTKKQFATNCALSVILTKELWLVCRGPVESKPDELVFVHPYNIQIFADPSSPWPFKITTLIKGDNRSYTREDGPDGRFRYIDDMRMNELFPYISERNEMDGEAYFRGISGLSAIKDELMSYSASIVGNTSSIENAGRPSGIISPKDDSLTPDQLDDIADSLTTITGATANGKLALIPYSVEAAFQAWAPKDMDYETLQKNVKQNIWLLLEIPLAMVTEATQTFNNVEIAEVAFYDSAVQSPFTTVADAWKRMLETRFDLDGLIISFNQFEVPALKRRAVSRMKDLSESQVLTVNEVRHIGGYEDTENGEKVLVNSGRSTLETIVTAPDFAVPPTTAPTPTKPTSGN